MKSENLLIVESFFKNPLQFIVLEEPQIYENMTVIPIVLKDNKFIDFITIQEAEELNLIEIVETDSVNQLEVINNSDKEILIPFGVTVHGGKQDRTVWEPILLPAQGKGKIFDQKAATNVQKRYSIPAKCVEQSRWSVVKDRKFKASNIKLHPNVAFEAISPAGQGAVWQEIQFFRNEMKYDPKIAPTQSYLEMTKITETKTENFVKHFKNVNNQCGVAVFIDGDFIGIEFYANPKAWRSMFKDIIKAFSIEALRFKKENKTTKIPNDMRQEFLKILKNLDFNFSTRNGIGLGVVVEFKTNDNKWRGITLTHDETMVQLYLVKKRGGATYTSPHDIQVQTIIDNRFQL